MERDTIRRTRTLWAALILGWWTLNGFASASQYHLYRGLGGEPITWSHALLTSMASAYLWIPITIFALWSSWRFPLDRDHWPRRLPLHIGAAAGVVVFRAGAVVVFNDWIGWYITLPPFTRVLAANFATNAFFYWMLVGAAHAVHYAGAYRRRERDAEQLRTELVRAELDALRARLQPHFLFNALNTISSLIGRRPEAAERMVARLGDLLRHSLDRDGAQEVELRDELKLAASYLAIEEARFEDRLHVHWDVDAGTLPARVPPLILQPLVENAVRHGIAPRSAPGRIHISATRVEDSLHLVVRDDGVGMPDPLHAVAHSGGGVGLRSTRTRLQRLYGEHHTFRIGHATGGGVVVEITLPFTAPAAEAPDETTGDPNGSRPAWPSVTSAAVEAQETVS